MTSSEQDVLKSTIYIEHQIEHSQRQTYLEANSPITADIFAQTVQCRPTSKTRVVR